MIKDVYKILVVEDTFKHQEAARALLEGHDITLVDCFEAACDALGGEGSRESISRLATPYDVLLTDLFYPQGREARVTGDYAAAGEQQPFGIFLAQIAARLGVPYIGVVTDMDHHKHPLAYAFDFFKDSDPERRIYGASHRFTVDTSRVMYFDIRDLEDACAFEHEGEVETHLSWEGAKEAVKTRKGISLLEALDAVTAWKVKNWKGALEALVRQETVMHNG